MTLHTSLTKCLAAFVLGHNDILSFLQPLVNTENGYHKGESVKSMRPPLATYCKNGGIFLSNFNYNEYYKQYRKEHPEKRKQWDINYWVKRLRLLGYTVEPPKEVVTNEKE